MHHGHSGLQQRAVVRTVAVLGGLAAVALAVGALWGGRAGLAVAMVVCCGVISFAVVGGDALVLRAMHARPVGEAEQPVLYRLVRELSTAARLPMPRLYVSPTPAPNAFATGRSPRRAAVCCTEGLLRILNERELRGVIAHEIAHIRNRDTLVSSVAAALAASVVLLADFVWLLPGGSDDDGPGPIGILVTAILGPFGAMVVQIAVARSREHRADLAAATLTGDPGALADALRKLEVGTRVLPLRAEPELMAAGHLMIANPFPPGGPLSRIFRTHPPLRDRIARLDALQIGPPTDWA